MKKLTVRFLNRTLYNEFNYNSNEPKNFVQSNIALLTPEQKIVYATIINRVKNNEGGLIFLEAPRGTGKTFLLNLLLATIRSDNDIALAVASSGIAAALL